MRKRRIRCEGERRQLPDSLLHDRIRACRRRARMAVRTCAGAHETGGVIDNRATDPGDDSQQHELHERAAVRGPLRIGLEDVVLGDPHTLEDGRAAAGHPLPEAGPVVCSRKAGSIGTQEHGNMPPVAFSGDRDEVGEERTRAVELAAVEPKPELVASDAGRELTHLGGASLEGRVSMDRAVCEKGQPRVPCG